MDSIENAKRMEHGHSQAFENNRFFLLT